MKSSTNDLTHYHPYMRDGIKKYGLDGWMTFKITMNRIKRMRLRHKIKRIVYWLVLIALVAGYLTVLYWICNAIVFVTQIIFP